MEAAMWLHSGCPAGGPAPWFNTARATVILCWPVMLPGYILPFTISTLWLAHRFIQKMRCSRSKKSTSPPWLKVEEEERNTDSDTSLPPPPPYIYTSRSVGEELARCMAMVLPLVVAMCLHVYIVSIFSWPMFILDSQPSSEDPSMKNVLGWLTAAVLVGVWIYELAKLPLHRHMQTPLETWMLSTRLSLEVFMPGIVGQSAVYIFFRVLDGTVGTGHLAFP